jgi:hypothetical protein
MDFFITLSDSNSSGPSFKGFKILRVLKPLRTVKRIPRMKKLVDNLFDSLSDLSNTLIFMLFSMIVAGIMGIQLFHGQTYQRCRKTEFPNQMTGIWEIDENQNFICQVGDYDKEN